MEPKSIDHVFWDAAHLPEGDEREAYLQQACATDAELRRKVEQLLRAQSKAASFLESPVVSLSAFREPSLSEGPGTSIGPYKLLEQIGEGGFGVVFMAEQQRPVRRQVALKVLKPGMDTRQVVARFEAERQALAMMDHANIAHVFDAGETASGRPYFVMELVSGVSITGFCDTNQLSVRRRLELFILVCQAVQHAHQKGIIHRDLKPSNILVTSQDGGPVVKVIDFGIAKATSRQLTDQSLFTQLGQVIGTPTYMSPEQAERSGLDVDTRSDIYSLGVLLYELLTGTTPFDRERLRSASYDELRRIIREEEPPRPSTRLTTLGQAATTVSEQRRTDPRRLSQLFRGELDWIVMKALEKDRGRRYETASAFAADVERYLRDEPVTACLPSAWYRSRKFARRHRWTLAMAAVVSMALILAVATIAGTIGWVSSDQAARAAALDGEVDRILDEAAARIDEMRWPEAKVAIERAEKLLVAAGRQEMPPRIPELKQDLAMVSRIDAPLHGRNPSLREEGYSTQEELQAVDDGFKEGFQEYGMDVCALTVPEAAERLRNRRIRIQLASALDYWAGIRCRIHHVDRASWIHLLEIAREIDPDPWRNRLRDVLRMSDSGRSPNLAEKQALLALAASADLRDMPPRTLSLLAYYLFRVKANDEIRDLLRNAQLKHPGDFRINHQLGVAYCRAVPPRYDEALRHFSAALAARPSVLYFRYCIGETLLEKGSFQEAVKELTTLLEQKHDHVGALALRGKALLVLNRPVEAAADFSKLIETHPQRAQFYASRAGAYESLQHWDKALTDYDQALALQKTTAEWWHQRGQVLAVLNQWDKAAADLAQAVALRPTQDLWRQQHGSYCLLAGDAEGYRRARHEMLERFGRTENPGIAERIALGCLLAPASADDLQLSVQLAGFAAVGLPQWSWSRLAHGLALYRTGKFEQAVRELRALADTWTGDPNTGTGMGNDILLAWLVLAMANQGLDRTEEARGWLDRAVQKMDRDMSEKPMRPNLSPREAWPLCLVLRREAESLILTAGAGGPRGALKR